MDANRPAPGSFGGLGAGSIVSRNIQPLLDADPRQIGPYLVRGRLGQGAMGHVFLAFAPNGPAYALKVLRPDFATDSDFRRRFTREIAAARAVHSPFVNAVTDADPNASTPWLASYFIPGPPLSSAVQLAGPFTPRSVAHLCVGIGLALQAIHTAGIVHRDLKPANVLVASDGPRVIDFGIARAVDASMLTSTGMRLGTPSFMAPEQVAGSEVGAAADVWAVGGMLVYAATGRTAFGDGNAMSILYRVEHHEPNLEGLEPALAYIARACLAKDPAARPTPAQLVEMCRAALDGGGSGIPALAGSDVTGWLPAAVSRDLASRQVELASVRQGWEGAAPAVGLSGGSGSGSKGGGRGGFLRRKGGGSGGAGEGTGAQQGFASGVGQPGWGTASPQQQPTGSGNQGAWAGQGSGPDGAWGTGSAPDGSGGQPAWSPGGSAAPGGQPAWGQSGSVPSNAPGQFGAPGSPAPGAPAWGPSGPSGSDMPTVIAPVSPTSPGDSQTPAWRTAANASASPQADQASSESPWTADEQARPATVAGLPPGFRPIGEEAKKLVASDSDTSSATADAPAQSLGERQPFEVSPADSSASAWQPAPESAASAQSAAAPFGERQSFDPSPAESSSSTWQPAAESESPAPPSPTSAQESRSSASEQPPPRADVEAAFGAAKPSGPAVPSIAEPTFATEFNIPAVNPTEPTSDEQPAPSIIPSIAPPTFATEFNIPAVKPTDSASEDGAPAASSVGIPSIAPPAFATEFNIPAVKPTDSASEVSAPAASSVGIPSIAPPAFATEFNIPAVTPTDTASKSEDGAPAAASVGIPSIAPPAFATEFNIPAVTPTADSAPKSDTAAPADVPSIAPPTFATEFNIPAVKPNDSASEDSAPAASSVDVPSIAPPTFATEFGIPAVTPAPTDPAAETTETKTGGAASPDLTATARTDTSATAAETSAAAWSPAAPVNHAPPIPPHLQQPMTPPKNFTSPASASSSQQPPAAPPTPTPPYPASPQPPQQSPLPPYQPPRQQPPPFGQPAQPAQFGQPSAPAHFGYQAPPQQQSQPQSHMTIVPPPPSMSSPYGAPQPKPTLYDTDTLGSRSRTKRIGIIAGAVVLVAAGIIGAVFALSGSGGDSPKPTPTTTAGAPPADTTPPSSQPTSPAAAGVPGKTAGEEGAKDVVLRGLYGAAADRDFQTVCTSQTVSAQKGAAKAAGWDGKGDPLPLCVKYFKDNWSAIDATYLRGRKVVGTKPGANATTMLITVDDPPPSGNGTTRTFTVVWDNTHWLLEAAAKA
ncbi:MAG: protein kinase [Catenulisporales bacterium]|nr:protein kinase [Catenulisporales bacterium]